MRFFNFPQRLQTRGKSVSNQRGRKRDQQRSSAAGARRARRPFAVESLETRRVMADDLTVLSDEFDNAASITNWAEVNQVEGWGPRGAQLNQWTVNGNNSGEMLMQPHTVVWYGDWRGPLVFKEITGDFIVSTRLRIEDRDNVGSSDADSIPGDSPFSLGGLMIRTPRPITNGAADWQPGSQSDDGTNVGENYVFMSMGYTSGVNRLSFEVKTTRNSNSVLEVSPVGLQPNEVELRIARIGSAVIVLHRLDGEANWTVHRRYSRPDMPQTLQVGMVTYSDWEKANDLTPVVHNGSVIAPGQVVDPTPDQPFNPDLTASFDYTRFERPQVPVELAGVNLLTATDNQLLGFLGQGGDANPAPPKRTRIGMNAAGVVDWDPGMMFRDAFQRARPWGTQAQNVATGDRTWQFLTGEGPTLAVDQQGWVTSLPQWQHSDGTVYQQVATTVIFTDHARQPAGIYRAEWTGNGNLEMPFVTESGTTADGRHYALVNMPFGAHFAMEITSTDPANPIRDIHLWMPDYNGQSLVGDWQPGDAGSPFHPLFVDLLDEFDTLRFMDLMTTNRSDVVTWNDRPKLTDASQSDGDLLEFFHTHGVAPEYLIELSNETGANPWFNMPYQANDDYVRQFATLVRDTLDPDLKVYVEWSNEVWNGFFPTYHWVAAQTQLPENAGLDFFAIAGREMRRDFDIWSDVFAGQEDRLVRVVAGQQANVWLTEQFLANVDGRVDAVSSTAYAGIGAGQVAGFNPLTTTADDIIDSLLNVSIPWASARLREHESLVETYEAILGRDLEFVTYESGSHVMGDPNPFYNTELADEALAAQSSPRMYDVYQTLLGVVNDAGVDLYNEFSFSSHATVLPFGSYGVIHDMTTPLSEAHKLRFLYDYIAAHPEESNAPTITAIADQQILEDAATSAIAFGIADPQVDVSALVVTASSSDTTLVPLANIVLGGSGANRTIQVAGAANRSGTTVITVTVDNGTRTTTETFDVTITAVNDAPTITPIANQTTVAGGNVGPVAIAIDDVDNAAGTLTLAATSTNLALVPLANIAFAGSGANRSLTVTPVAGQIGTTDITVTVSDGAATANSVFRFTVTSPNTPPVITSLSTNTGNCAIGLATSVKVSGQFTDLDSAFHTVQIQWGDGTTTAAAVDQVRKTFSTSHVYTTANLTTGSFQILATVSDGSLQDSETISVRTIGAQRIGNVVEVTGSSVRDSVVVRPVAGSSPAEFVVEFANTANPSAPPLAQRFRVAEVSEVRMDLCDGNDAAVVRDLASLRVTISGGAGADTLTSGAGLAILLGGEGADILRAGTGGAVLIGDAGKDFLYGGVGRDVMIGGAEADYLFGQSQDDILIGGTTSYDRDIPALVAIHDQWRQPTTRAARIATLDAGVIVGSRSVRLRRNVSVFDDNAVDSVFADANRNWRLDS